MIRTEVVHDRILWITLDAPDTLNAFVPETMAAMADAWQRLREDDTLHVGVVTGAGERAFCVGSNLKTFIPRLQSGELSPRSNEGCYLKGTAGPVYKPVVAAVNGDCLGGGMELLTCTDVRLTVPDARFGQPEPRWGVFPGGGGTTRLPRQIGYAHAMDILLTGRLLSADEAVGMGLVSRVVPREELGAVALEVAVQIAGNGPLALRAIKESVWRGADLSLDEAYELESTLGEAVFVSDEAAEGLAAFAERREPSFRSAVRS